MNSLMVIHIVPDLLALAAGAIAGGFLNALIRRLSPESNPAGDAFTHKFSLVLSCAVAALLLYLYVAPIERSLLFFSVFCVLLAITFIDADIQEIPNSLNAALAALGLVSIWIWPDIDISSRLIGAACVSGPLCVMSVLIRGSFGFGDVKLMAAAGFLLGWQMTCIAFFIGMLGGGAYGAYALLLHKKSRKDTFALGPCLAAGIFITMLLGKEILSWYLEFSWFYPSI